MGNILGQMMGGGAPSAGPQGAGMLDMLTKMAGSMLGGGQGGTPSPGLGQGMGPGSGGGGGLPVDILKQLAGAVLGGSKPAVGNAGAGAGSMALFGMLAAQALEMAKGMLGGGQQAQAGSLPKIQLDDQAAVLAGVRPPQTPAEEQQLMDVATLTIKAMISAAKADGRVDEEETQRLIGKLGEGGISEEEQRFVAKEMQRPLDLDSLVRAVPNQQVAAQIYTASLMAINLDTDAEKRYMADLADKLGLNPQVVSFLHTTVGVA
jgi:uncharacterized membrane protein YebE (DUF533 family)